MTASNYLENAVGDKVFRAVNFTVTTPYISLHTADPGDTGANEVTGGSYARQSSTWSAFASGASATSGAVSFTLMPAAAAPGVVAYGIWDASSAGNCLQTGWLTNSGEGPKPFVLSDTTTDLFIAPSHGYANGDIVVFSTEVGATTIPTGVTAGTLYYVVNTATHTFQVSTTSGGSAVAITGVGSGFVQRVVPKTVNAGDTLTFNTGSLTQVIY